MVEIIIKRVGQIIIKRASGINLRVPVQMILKTLVVQIILKTLVVEIILKTLVVQMIMRVPVQMIAN